MSTTSKSLSDKLNVSKSIRDKRNALAKKAEASQSKSLSRYKGKSKKVQQALKHYWGWDTEFDKDYATGEPIPVTTQIAIPCNELPDNLLELEARLSKKDNYNLVILKYDFVDVRGVGKFLWIVFDSSGIEPGLPYATHLGNILKWLSQDVCKWDTESEHECTLLAHYNNAEWSLVAPTKASLRELKLAQGDTEENTEDGLIHISIQKSALYKNFKLGQPKNVRFNVADTMHAFGKCSVEDVGASVGLPKLWHPNFEETPYSEWKANDPEAAITYAGIDAVITVAAYLRFAVDVSDIFNDLCDKNLLDRNNKIVKKILDEEVIPATAAGVTDRLYRSFMESKGFASKWDDANLVLYSKILPLDYQIPKGGLNKKFDSDRPTLVKNCVRADVNAQYPTAMTMLKLPLVEPYEVVISCSNKWKFAEFVTKQVRKELEDIHKGDLIVDIELPENATEWERTVVFKDPITGDGCTTRKAEWQLLKHWELFLISIVTPKAKIKVRRFIKFPCGEEGKDHFTITPVVSYLMEERNKYKKQKKRLEKLKDEREEFGSSLTDEESLELVGAELKSNAVKLILNGGAGKFAQNKQGYDPSSLHRTIMRQGEVTTVANGRNCRSKIYSVDAFNDITAMSRVYTAYAGWLNKAVMVVTDSIVFQGKFKDPKDHLTGIPQLDELFTTFRFDIEAEGVDEVIYKEREHVSFDWGRNKSALTLEMFKSGKLACFAFVRWFVPEYKSICLQVSLETGEDHLPKECKIEKFAMRGVSRIRGVSEQESRRILFRETLPRFQGKSVTLTQKRLLGFKEYMKGKTLNAEEEVKKRISAHNPRHNCESLSELDLRKQLNRKCKSEKINKADILDYEVHDPHAAAKLKASTKHKAKVSRNYPLELKQMLTILNRECGICYSPRFIEKLFDSYGLKVSDTTITRWIKDVELSKAYDCLKLDYGWSEADYFKKSAWTEKLKTDVEEILGLLGGAS